MSAAADQTVGERKGQTAYEHVDERRKGGERVQPSITAQHLHAGLAESVGSLPARLARRRFAFRRVHLSLPTPMMVRQTESVV